MKLKKGEQQAKLILEKKGYIFDNNYWDDNSKESMPDLRYATGNYLEVTHTKHNHIKVDIENEIHSIDNIIFEIKEDKGLKYRNRSYGIDLFCFITEKEYADLEKNLKEYPNNNATLFIRTVLESPFERIYLCVWDLNNRLYEIDNPMLITIRRDES